MNAVKHNDMVDIKGLEYETLRSELLQNQRYVFGRPVFVLSAGVAVAATVADKYIDWVILVCPFIAMLMMLDLWFSLSRLKSLFRISAYIALAHESNDYTWIGWENALQIYREKEKQSSTSGTASGFSSWKLIVKPSFAVHLISEIGTLVITILTYSSSADVISLGALIANIVMVVFFILVLTHPFPLKWRKPTFWTENHREIWKDVLDEKVPVQPVTVD